MVGRKLRIVLAIYFLGISVAVAVVPLLVSDADLSQLGRPGGPTHKGARLAETAYRAGGRAGFVVVCLGISGLLLVASIRTLIREFAAKRPTDGGSQQALPPRQRTSADG